MVLPENSLQRELFGGLHTLYDDGHGGFVTNGGVSLLTSLFLSFPPRRPEPYPTPGGQRWGGGGGGGGGGCGS